MATLTFNARTTAQQLHRTKTTTAAGTRNYHTHIQSALTDSRTTPAPLNETPHRQRLSIDKKRNMIGPLPRDVHKTRPQALLDQPQASTQAQRALILGTHAHLHAMKAKLAHHQIKDKTSNQGTQASSAHSDTTQYPSIPDDIAPQCTFDTVNWPTKRPSIWTPKIRPVPSR